MNQLDSCKKNKRTVFSAPCDRTGGKGKAILKHKRLKADELVPSGHRDALFPSPGKCGLKNSRDSGLPGQISRSEAW